MGRLSVLSPRRLDRELEDWGERRALVGHQRVDRRRRVARRARRLAPVALAALVVLALSGAGALGARWLLTSPRFAVAEVEVRGASRLAAEEIIAASGIRRGVNLWRLDPAEVVAGVEALSAVRRAEVIRAFPNRVTVVVEELPVQPSRRAASS